MYNVPTLLIGLGGIGSRIASMVSDRMTDDEKRYVSALAVDTDFYSIDSLCTDAGQSANTEDISVKEFFEKYPEALDWYNNNPAFRLRIPTRGDQVCGSPTLSFYDAFKEGRLDALHKAIDRINRVNGSPVSSCLRVLIVGSLCGGTSSGLLFQVPLYIRYYMRLLNISNVFVRGLFITPDVLRDVVENKSIEKALLFNSYACINELNSFYRKQTAPACESPASMPFYDLCRNTASPRVSDTEDTVSGPMQKAWRVLVA